LVCRIPPRLPNLSHRQALYGLIDRVGPVKLRPRCLPLFQSLTHTGHENFIELKLVWWFVFDVFSALQTSQVGKR
jgi:hypothetical protein